MNRETSLRVVRTGKGATLREEFLQVGQEFLQAFLDGTMKKMQSEMDSMVSEVARSKKLAISTQGETEYILAGEVVRLEASGCYTLCFLSDGRKVMVSRTLGEFERILDAYDFVRVHHSHLVNLARVKKYHKKDGYMVRMEDDQMVPVAVRRKDIFEMKMKALTI